MGRAGGKHPHRLVAAQSWRTHFESGFVFKCLMEHKQQPDMADVLQALHGIALIEGGDQFQHATGGRGQLRLARNGEFLFEARAHKTDRGDAVGQKSCLCRSELARDRITAVIQNNRVVCIAGKPVPTGFMAPEG